MKKTRNVQSKKTKGTLDKKHTEKIQRFEQLNKSLPIKKIKLDQYKKELDKLKKMDPNSYTHEDIHRKSCLMDKIRNLSNEISCIENCTESLNYIVTALPFLVDYYNTTDDPNDFIDEELINETTINDPNNVMSYLLRESVKTELTKNVKDSGSKTIKKKLNRAKLYDKYLNATEIGHKKSCGDKIKTKCTQSGCEGNTILNQNDGFLVCTKCGFSEPVLITNDKSIYKEKSQDSAMYAYKRINHLQEILSQLQAKESTEIPAKVYHAIYRELKKKKIDKNDLDIFKLRRILKRLNFRKYYEHVPHILQNINGKEPPNFSRSDENKIRTMFKEIQKPFELFCPKDRKNFLNYSYVLHKFCELLGLDEYIEYFPLLKNSKKLLHHDKIWKQICGFMKWEFIKSI